MYTAEVLKERLSSFGYEAKREDEPALSFSLGKVRDSIRNDTNLNEIPAGLEHIAIDMAAGEFLLSKKTFAPADLAGLDLSMAVSQIKEGDTTVQFGEGSQTPEQRLTSFINHLLSYGKGEFTHYRRLRW